MLNAIVRSKVDLPVLMQIIDNIPKYGNLVILLKFLILLDDTCNSDLADVEIIKGQIQLALQAGIGSGRDNPVLQYAVFDDRVTESLLNIPAGTSVRLFEVSLKESTEAEQLQSQMGTTQLAHVNEQIELGFGFGGKL